MALVVADHGAHRGLVSERLSQVPNPRSSVEQIHRPEVFVVGVNGSEASVQALVWVLKYALEHDATVEVVTAWPVDAAVFVGEVPGHFNEARWKAIQAQARALAHATSLVADLPPYLARVENATAFDALVRSAESAALLVLGTDRQEASDAGSAGSLTVRAQQAVRCPVVLISAGSAPERELVGERGKHRSTPSPA